MKQEGHIKQSEVRETRRIRERIARMDNAEFRTFQQELQYAYLFNKAMRLSFTQINIENLDEKEVQFIKLLYQDYTQDQYMIVNSVLYDEIRNQINTRKDKVLDANWTGWYVEDEEFAKGVKEILYEHVKNAAWLELNDGQADGNEIAKVQNRIGSLRKKLSDDYNINSIFLNSRNLRQIFDENYLVESRSV